MKSLILAIDIGNTVIKCGILKENKIIREWTLSSKIRQTADETGMIMKMLFQNSGLDMDDVKNVVISSVVPDLRSVFRSLSQRYFNLEPLFVDHTVNLGIGIDVKDPSSVGADRLCTSVAGFEKFGGPVLIIDFGTATTYDIVSKEGNYIGGLISPGVEIQSGVLHQSTAKLPAVPLVFPDTFIGKTTEEHIQIGILWGTVLQVEGFIKKFRSVLGEDLIVVAAGGLGSLVAEKTSLIDHTEPQLILEGLRIINSRCTS